MTATIVDLDRNPWPKAADVIDEVGWTRHTMKDDRGRVCLTGAIRECAPVPGDWAIVREVANHRKHGEAWNDVQSRRKGQVTGWLREAEPITDDELLEVFGPQWEHVVALVRKVASLSMEDRDRYWSACSSLYSSSAAYRQARGAVIVGGGPGYAARRAVGAIAVYGVSAGVAAALARRHEIGTAFTQQQYDLVVGPWVKLFGPVHPEDVAS